MIPLQFLYLWDIFKPPHRDEFQLIKNKTGKSRKETTLQPSRATSTQLCKLHFEPEIILG